MSGTLPLDVKYVTVMVLELTVEVEVTERPV